MKKSAVLPSINSLDLENAMQKKMNLDQLKIRSFVTTQEKEVKGGTGRVCMPPTYFWYLCTDGLCA